MLQDDPDPTEPELDDFVYNGENGHVNLERPPRDVDEPRP
jgi:hypothetical protein